MSRRRKGGRGEVVSTVANTVPGSRLTVLCAMMSGLGSARPAGAGCSNAIAPSLVGQWCCCSRAGAGNPQSCAAMAR
eukprot:1544530-Pyramimonas_sp.AAC.1